MKILIVAIGTRGDIEPFLPVAEYYSKKGHQVLCLFPAQFESLTKDVNVGFQPLSHQFLEMLNSEEGRSIIGGKLPLFKRIKTYIKLYKKSNKISHIMNQEQHQVINEADPDLIIHSLKATYPLFWSVKNNKKIAMISPIPCVIHPVKGMSAISFQGRDFGTSINRLSHKLMTSLMAGQTIKMMKPFQGDKPISKAQFEQKLLEEDIMFSISPSLAPTFEEDKPQAKIIGYPERDKSVGWIPEQGLVNFINSQGKILFLSFGSMTNAVPEQVTATVLTVLSTLKIAAIINTSVGGLLRPDEYDSSQFYFTEQIPYDWILPQVYAVVHHGGSGTTHMGLRSGCPTLIIPHIADQFLWNQIVYNKGVGPKGKGIGKLKKDWLQTAIKDLFENQDYLKNAETLGREMANETFHFESLDKLLEPEQEEEE